MNSCRGRMDGSSSWGACVVVAGTLIDQHCPGWTGAQGCPVESQEKSGNWIFRQSFFKAFLNCWQLFSFIPLSLIKIIQLYKKLWGRQNMGTHWLLLKKVLYFLQKTERKTKQNSETTDTGDEEEKDMVDTSL